MGKRPRLASWDLHSKCNETVVHITIDGGSTVLCNGQYIASYGNEYDTLANNKKKRPCTDCLWKYRASLDKRKEILDKEYKRLDMFSELKKGSV